MTETRHPLVADLLRRYAAGERDFAETEMDEIGDIDMSGVVLDDADFSHSWFVCSFEGASLRKASFRRANLKTCDFKDADLTDADFRGAALEGTEFKDAIINGTKFDDDNRHWMTHSRR